MDLTSILVPTAFIGLMSLILFQLIFMMISPQRWARSKYSIKSSGQHWDEMVRERWGRVYLRVIGFFGTVYVGIYLVTFITRL